MKAGKGSVWKNFLFILAGIMIGSQNFVLAEYVDVVEDYSILSRVTVSDVLGPPDSSESYGYGEFDGEPGFVIVGFSEGYAKDGAGADVRVHLWNWTPNDNEIFSLLASWNNQDYTHIGTAIPADYEPYNGSERFSITFDFNGLIDTARYFKIVNEQIRYDTTQEGPEIDAVEAIYYVPEPVSFLMLGLGGLILRSRC